MLIPMFGVPPNPESSSVGAILLAQYLPYTLMSRKDRLSLVMVVVR